MIYTVTLSPALDYVMELDNLLVGEINRSKTESYLAGGKGINVSIVLNNLGAKSIALGFTAGFVGKYIEDTLNAKGIVTDFINVEGNSRINVKVRSNAETAINGAGPKVNDNNLNMLINKLVNIEDDSIVVLSGALPKNFPNDTYELILKALSNKNVKVVVDSTKETLLNTLKYKPFLIKPNKEELEETLNIKINNDNDLMIACKKLISLGAKNVIVSLGSDGAHLYSENIEAIKMSSPKGTVVNTVGAGDSLVAGFLYEYEKTKDFKLSLKMGVAAGSASAFSLDLATKDEILSIYNEMR